LRLLSGHQLRLLFWLVMLLLLLLLLLLLMKQLPVLVNSLHVVLFYQLLTVMAFQE
jgi:hypothetical protein